MNHLTLRQLCEKYGVTRRAVQGYEKFGLVKPSGRTDKGYLLYDEAAQKTVVMAKEFQNYGFSLREIAAFGEASESQRRAILLEKRARLLEHQRESRRILSSLDILLQEEYGIPAERDGQPSCLD